MRAASLLPPLIVVVAGFACKGDAPAGPNAPAGEVLAVTGESIQAGTQEDRTTATGRDSENAAAETGAEPPAAPPPAPLDLAPGGGPRGGADRRETEERVAKGGKLRALGAKEGESEKGGGASVEDILSSVQRVDKSPAKPAGGRLTLSDVTVEGDPDGAAVEGRLRRLRAGLQKCFAGRGDEPARATLTLSVSPRSPASRSSKAARPPRRALASWPRFAAPASTGANPCPRSASP